MIRLLVSVRDANEAREAIRGGADLIDVKEPTRGALGAATPDVWADVGSVVDGEKPLSVALGELNADDVLSLAPQTANIQFAKLGLAGCRRRNRWRSAWREVLDCLPTGTSPVAVVYADHLAASAPVPEAVISEAIQAGCAAILFDTYQKNDGNLFHHLGIDPLTSLVRTARDNDIMVVLAGSLNERSIPTAMAIEPDFIAIRGAACAGDRTGQVTSDRTRHIANIVHQSANNAAPFNP